MTRAAGLSFCTRTLTGTGLWLTETYWETLTTYSPATMPRMVRTSSRIGVDTRWPLMRIVSCTPPRSSRSSVRKPASLWRYQAMFCAGSCTMRSISSGLLSGQSMVTTNSALESILPWLAFGAIASTARKNRNETTCSALNSMRLNGSKPSSRPPKPKSSNMPALDGRDQPRLRQPRQIPEGGDGRRFEHEILGAQQDRTDKAGQRRVHRHRHAFAHHRHRGARGSRVIVVEAGDGAEHQDEADYGAEQAELYHRVGRQPAERRPAPQPLAQSPQQQRLVEPAGAARRALGEEIADVLAEQAARQPRRQRREVGERRPIAPQPRQPGDLARDGDRAGEAVQARRNIDRGDDRRQAGAVGLDDDADQAIAPQRHGSEGADAGEDQPAQHRVVGAINLRRPGGQGRGDRVHSMEAPLPSPPAGLLRARPVNDDMRGAGEILLLGANLAEQAAHDGDAPVAGGLGAMLVDRGRPQRLLAGAERQILAGPAAIAITRLGLHAEQERLLA